MNIQDPTNEIVDQEYHQLRKRAKKEHSQKLGTIELGLEYAEEVKQDQDLIKGFILQDNNFELNLNYEIQFYLVEKIRKAMKQIYLDQQGYYENLVEKVFKYVEEETYRYMFHVQAQAVILGIALDVFRFLTIEKSFRDPKRIQKLVNKVHQWILEQKNYKPMLLLLRSFKHQISDPQYYQKNEQKLVLQFKFRISTLLLILFKKIENGQAKNRQKRLFEIATQIKESPLMDPHWKQYLSKYPRKLEQYVLTPFQTIQGQDLASAIKYSLEPYTYCLPLSNPGIMDDDDDEIPDEHELRSFKNEIKASKSNAFLIDLDPMELSSVHITDNIGQISPSKRANSNMVDMQQSKHLMEIQEKKCQNNDEMPYLLAPSNQPTNQNYPSFSMGNNGKEISMADDGHNQRAHSYQNFGQSFPSKSKEVIPQQEMVSPEEEELYKQVDQLLEIEKEEPDIYTQIIDINNFTAEKRKVAGQSVVLIRARAKVMGIPADHLRQLISNLDYRNSWEKILTGFELVETVNDKVDYIYSLIRAPFGITNRDFMQKRIKLTNYKGCDHVIRFTHTDHPLKPETKNFIRAHTIISGYLIRKAPENPENDSLLTIVAQTDIKGMIPKYLVNLNAGKQPKIWIKSLEEGYIRLKQQGAFK